VAIDLGHPLVVEALRVVANHSNFEDVAVIVRTKQFRARMGSKQWGLVRQAALDGRPLSKAPHGLLRPLDFVTAALAYEVAKHHPRDVSRVRKFASWALRSHVVTDRHLMPVVERLAGELVSTTDRKTDPRLLVECLLLRGDALSRGVASDPAGRQEEALDCYREAIDILASEPEISPDRAPLLWVSALNSHAIALKDCLRGNRQENLEQASSLIGQALGIAHSPDSLHMQVMRAQVLATAGRVSLQKANLSSDPWPLVRPQLSEPSNPKSAVGSSQEAIQAIDDALEDLEEARRILRRSGLDAELTLLADIGHAYTIRGWLKVEKCDDGFEDDLEVGRDRYWESLLIVADDAEGGDREPAFAYEIQSHLANSYAFHSDCLEQNQQGESGPPLAVEYRVRAASLLKASAEGYLGSEMEAEAIGVYASLGSVQIALGHWGEALKSFSRAADLIRKQLGDGLADASRLAWLRHNGGAVYDGLVASLVELSTGFEEGITARKAAEAAENVHARILSDLAFLAEQEPSVGEESSYERFLGSVRDLIDADYRLDEMEPWDDGYVQLRLRRRNVSGGVGRESDRFRRVNPSFRTQAPAMLARDMEVLADRANAALVILRPTPYGTCAIAILPQGGGVHAKRLENFTSESVEHLLADSTGGAGKVNDGLMLSYHRFREADRKGDANAEGLRQEWLQDLRVRLSRVWDDLWEPLRRWLEEDLGYRGSTEANDPKPLVVVPAGPGIGIIPLHAACHEEPTLSGQWRYADRDFRISYTPSLRVLARVLDSHQGISERTPRRLLAVRNPTGDLPFSESEVDWILDLFEETNVLSHGGQHKYKVATSESLVRELPHWSVALVATHGRWNLRYPYSRTGLLMAGDDANGIPSFTPRDILRLDLSGLWLALLSACETSLTEYFDGCGDSINLVSSFLAAGARSVIGTLWIVDDQATSLLIYKFFNELIELFDNNKIFAPGVALHHAQKWLRELDRDQVEGCLKRLTNGTLTEESIVPPGLYPFKDPYYWAGFCCYGLF
jgi:CHAT domain-containing protein/tetratricopeptide (TPR) repeat protein